MSSPDSIPSSNLVSTPGLPLAPRPIARVWPLTLGAGLLAGLIAWLGGEGTLDLIKPARHEVNSKGMLLQVTDRWGEMTTDSRNAAIAFAILGGAVGTCFGLAGGLATGSARRGLAAAVLGFAVGAAGSVALAAGVLSPYNAYRYQYPDEASRDLILPLLIHSSIWAVAGLAGGLAFAFGAHLNRYLAAKAAVAGLVGAIVATVVFELSAGLIFEDFDSGKLVAATTIGRLVARFAVTLGVAGAVATTIADRRNQRATTPA